MTNEGRQDAVLVALVASLAVHAALMFVMRPRVMSHLVDVRAAMEARAARRMVVAEAEPPPDTIDMQAVPDVSPLREAPSAAPSAPSVGAASAPEGGVETFAPPPDGAPAAAELPQPAEAAAPYLSEKIHVEKGSPDFTTPVADQAPQMSAPSVAPAPSVGAAVPADVPVPMFTAPTYRPAAAEIPAAETRPAVPEPPPAARAEEAFVPVQDVMQQVDEKVVAREKEAVRDLLDVRGAKELDAFVNVAATSAQEGDWLYFRVQINPRAALETVPKDVVVLLDASGSIGEDRLQSCRAAARRILRSCTNTGDRFNLVAFRDRFSYAFKSWQECDKTSFGAADKWLNNLASYGRTDVFASARSVLTLPRDPARPLIALIVTDGDANEGVSETSQILSRFSALNDGLVSVYMYGVKGTANRELIDVLTHGNRGESFIYGGSRWTAGSEIESLSRRFRDPVLSDLRIVFATGTEAEAYPRLLRNLYRGEVVDFVGRVPAAGARRVAFSLKGLNGTRAYEGFFTVDLAGVGFDKELPAAWRAERAVDAKLRR